MSILSHLLRKKPKPQEESFDSAAIKALERQERHQHIQQIPWLQKHVRDIDTQATELSLRVCSMASNPGISNEEFACLGRALAVQAHTLRTQHNKLIE